MNNQLTHIDESGKIKMVDVSGKIPTERTAIARGCVIMRPETLALICDNAIPKGNVFATAQIAGIFAAKRAAELIPLCHNLPVSFISVEIEPDMKLPGVSISATVKTTSSTGVEMEALTAVSLAALTVYDMVKSVDKSMIINKVRLVEKHGGQSGDVHNE